MFGAYQAGAWKALSRRITPDIVVGASVGALNGWLIAAGAPAAELERLWLDPSSGELMKYLRGRAPWRGVFDPGPLEKTAKFLTETYRLRLDLGVALLELPRLRHKLAKNGDVTWRHLVATCSVPGGFAPVRIQGRLYCDGGLLQATPIWAAVEMGATRVIAVNSARFTTPAAVSMALRAGRKLGAMIGPSPGPATPEGVELIVISPKVPFGTMLDGARWGAGSIRRWIDLGEADATEGLG
jgi:NTE family protein